jgi:broad specificity phosphatase PhoE
MSTKGPSTIRRLCLLPHAATAAQRAFRFPADDEGIEPLDAGVIERRRAALAPATAVCGPERRCRETMAALQFDAVAIEALRAWRFGEWTGRRVEDVAAAESAAFAAWRSDPFWAPPAGESLTAVVARVGAWMDATVDGRFVAVADPTVVRAAIVHALDAEPATVWRIDVHPLVPVLLERAATGWRLDLR